MRRIVRKARRAAESMGWGVRKSVRRVLVELAGDDSADQEIAEIRELSMRSPGAGRGQRLDRGELHDRS